MSSMKAVLWDWDRYALNMRSDFGLLVQELQKASSLLRVLGGQGNIHISKEQG